MEILPRRNINYSPLLPPAPSLIEFVGYDPHLAAIAREDLGYPECDYTWDQFDHYRRIPHSDNDKGALGVYVAKMTAHRAHRAPKVNKENGVGVDLYLNYNTWEEVKNLADGSRLSDHWIKTRVIPRFRDVPPGCPKRVLIFGDITIAKRGWNRLHREHIRTDIVPFQILTEEDVDKAFPIVVAMLVHKRVSSLGPCSKNSKKKATSATSASLSSLSSSLCSRRTDHTKPTPNQRTLSSPTYPQLILYPRRHVAHSPVVADISSRGSPDDVERQQREEEDLLYDRWLEWHVMVRKKAETVERKVMKLKEKLRRKDDA